MDILFHEWFSLLFRWLHIITGIAWIGSSFYFIWLDLSLRKSKDTPEGVYGDTWMVHGGGFYHARKWLVAPKEMPGELHWFKYESYFTWMSGFVLLAIIYYWGAESYLIDRNVMALSQLEAIGLSIASLVGGWVIYDLICKSPLGRNTASLAVSVFLLILAAAVFCSEVFSARAAFLHVGAIVGTIMTGNVFIVIIPNQKRVVASLQAGEVPDASLGVQAKQRSTHNNYLTLPVLLMMISNHYPMTYGHEQSWLVVAAVLLLGGIVRDYFNTKNAGGTGVRVAWQWPVATLVTLGLMVVTARPNIESDGAKVSEAQVYAVVEKHCLSCHAVKPADDRFAEAPGGVALDDVSSLSKYADRIYAQVVTSDIMPLGNETGMTQDERDLVALWYQQRN